MPKRGKNHNHPNRRHTNNDGRVQIKRGIPHLQMKDLARRLGIPYGNPRDREADSRPTEST